MKINKIIIVSKTSQVDRYLRDNLKNNGLSYPGILFIAANPIVYSHLKQLGLPAQNTLPYFTSESHIKILDRSKILTDWLRENIKIVESEVSYQYASRETAILLIRSRLNYFLKFIEILSNAADIHQPQVISANPPNEKYASEKFLTFDENYLGQVAKLVAENKALRFEEIPDCGDKGFLRIIQNLKDAVKFIFKRLEFTLWTKKKLLESLLRREKPILLTTRRYNMDRLAERIREHYSESRPIFLKSPGIPDFHLNDLIIALLSPRLLKIARKQRKLFEELGDKLNANSGIFSYRGIPLDTFLNQSARDNIADYIINLLIWLQRLDSFIKALKPAAILTCGNRADDAALAEISEKNNIPIIFISHGSHVQPKNGYEAFEWGEQGMFLFRAPFSHLCLQTRPAEGYFKVFPSKSRIIKSGPLIWGTPVNFAKSKALYEEMFKEKYDFRKTKVVLHSGTPKICSRFYIYETSDEYLQSLIDLADTIEKMPNTVLIIRFRPSPEISLDAVKRIAPFSKKVILNADGRFIDILGMADLLVSFSSTTIEEALQNRIPVLQYGGAGRYEHVPAYEIEPGVDLPRKPVYHIKKTGDLGCAMRKILDLNINRENDPNLFGQYIYAEQERESFFDLIRQNEKK